MPVTDGVAYNTPVDLEELRKIGNALRQDWSLRSADLVEASREELIRLRRRLRTQNTMMQTCVVYLEEFVYSVDDNASMKELLELMKRYIAEQN